MPLADGTTPGVGSLGYGAKFGYLRDAETGFYLATYRHYDPSAGRWITRDPIGYDGGSNLYGYVDNDPANATDPSGLAERLAGARVEFWNNSSYSVPIIFDTEGTLGGSGPNKRVGWKLLVPPGYRTTMKVDVDYVMGPDKIYVHWFNPPGALADRLGIPYTHPGMICQASNNGSLFRPPTNYVVTGRLGKPANTNPKTGFPMGYEGGRPNGPSPLKNLPVINAITLGLIVKIPPRPQAVLKPW